MHQGAYALLLAEADRHFAAGGSGAPVDVWVTVRACQAAGALRDWGRVVAWAGRGKALAEACATSDRCREAGLLLHFLTGTALMYTGDLLRAGRELKAFRQGAPRFLNLRKLVGDALYNEGYLLRALGRRDEEVACFAEAARAYAELGREGQVAVCRYEVAWSLLLAGRAVEAATHLAAMEAGAAVDADLAADIQIAWALYHHMDGALDRSEAICQMLLLTRAELPDRQRADLYWIQGRNALARGERERAVSLADQACEAAVADWWPPQMERLSAFQVQVSAGTALHG